MLIGSPPSIIAVNLDTGAPTVLSDASKPNAANLFGSAWSLALDTAHNRVLVLDPFALAVFTVELDTGERQVLSSNTTPNTLTPFGQMSSIEVDAARNRALVAETLGRVLSVDLTTGARSVLSVGNGQMICSAIDSVIDAARDRVLLLDSCKRGIGAVDLTTGTPATFSSNSPPTAPVPLVEPAGIALDAANARLLVSDQTLFGVVAIDLRTADGSLLTVGNNPSDPAPISAPGALAIDAPANRLFVLETGRVPLFPPAIVAVDLTTGVRAVVTSSTHPNTNALLTTPNAMALDAAGARLLVTERDAHSVVAVDFATGARTIVSSPAVPEAANPFADPRGIVVDTANGRALIANSTYSLASSLFSMSLSTGARSVVSSNTQPAGAILMSGPEAVAFDAGRNRVLIADDLRQALLAVDLTSGARTLVSDSSDPDNPLDNPTGIAYDAAHELAYIVEANFAAVLVADLVTGRRVFLAH
jgi:sugar lactone lactonase YvrE